MTDISPSAPRVVPAPKGGAGLWLWVAGAFCVLILVWAVLFKVAHTAKVESVPLAPKGGRP